MGVTIETVNVGGNDKRMVLANATVARLMSIGNNWNKLRVLCRCAMDSTGGNLAGSPRQYIGVMSNPDATVTNGPLSGTTSHFVGNFSQIASWTYSATPNRYYLQGGDSYVPCKRVGNTNTTIVTGNFAHISAAPLTRCVLGVEITKGSPNFDVRPVSWWYNPTGMFDMANGVLEQGIVHPGTVHDMAAWFTAQTITTCIGWGQNLIAVDEGTNGPLNAVVVAWDRVSPAMHISEIIYCKLS